jgi:S1-C subfamily serine protease
MAFAAAYEWRKTLVAPVALHMMQNTVALVGTVIMAYVISNGPYLGILADDVEQGCQITQVEPDGSADKAGIKVGDIVVKFGDDSISDFSSLKKAIREHHVGQAIKVRFFRDNKLQEVYVQLKSRQQATKK